MARATRMAKWDAFVREANEAACRASERMEQLTHSSQELINQSVALRALADDLRRGKRAKGN